MNAKPRMRCYNYGGGTKSPCQTTYYYAAYRRTPDDELYGNIFRVEEDDRPKNWDELVNLHWVPFVGY